MSDYVPPNKKYRFYDLLKKDRQPRRLDSESLQRDLETMKDLLDPKGELLTWQAIENTIDAMHAGLAELEARRKSDFARDCVIEAARTAQRNGWHAQALSDLAAGLEYLGNKELQAQGMDHRLDAQAYKAPAILTTNWPEVCPHGVAHKPEDAPDCERCRQHQSVMTAVSRHEFTRIPPRDDIRCLGCKATPVVARWDSPGRKVSSTISLSDCAFYCGRCVPLESDDTINDPVFKKHVDAFFKGIDDKYVNKQCQCGAEKTNEPHARWCPKHE